MNGFPSLPRYFLVAGLVSLVSACDLSSLTSGKSSDDDTGTETGGTLPGTGNNNGGGDDSGGGGGGGGSYSSWSGSGAIVVASGGFQNGSVLCTEGLTSSGSPSSTNCPDCDYTFDVDFEGDGGCYSGGLSIQWTIGYAPDYYYYNGSYYDILMVYYYGTWYPTFWVTSSDSSSFNYATAWGANYGSSNTNYDYYWYGSATVE